MNSLYLIDAELDHKVFYAVEDLNLKQIDKKKCSVCGRDVWEFIYHSDTSKYLLETEHYFENGIQTGDLYVFPDILAFTGLGGHVFLISEKALSVFEREHVTGYNGYEKVEIRLPDDLKIYFEYITPPQYYKLNITGAVDFDLKAMCLKKKHVCPNCNQFNWNRLGFPKVQLNEITWDGSDLCRIQSCPGYTVCSKKLYSLISEHELTGFAFERPKIT